MPRDAAAPPPAVDLGAYAEIVGRTWLQGEDALGRELAERNVALDEWTSARAFWTEEIDAGIAAGGSDLVLAFAARFEASRRTKSPDLPAVALDGEKRSDAGEAPDALAPVRQEVPSYLQAQAQPSSREPSAPAAQPLYRTLVSARVLDEGVDVPDAEIAILAGGVAPPITWPSVSEARTLDESR